MKSAKITTILLVLITAMFLIIFSGCNNSSANESENPNNQNEESSCKHRFTEWEIYFDGYCQEKVFERHCEKCMVLEFKKGSESDHTWAYETINPTCTSDGINLKKCSKCSYSETLFTSPTQGHTLTYHHNTEKHWQECEICHEKFSYGYHNYNSGYCTYCDCYIDNPLAGEYNITMWVSEQEGVADQFYSQIEAFMAKNPGIVINASIKGVTEADAGSKIVADVATAPDIFCFRQDQLARLVQAAALAGPGGDVETLIKTTNDKGSVAAASVAGEVYAYPMTSDNGYYMYYDTSIISPAQAENLEDLIAQCEANGKTFRYALENAWYTASFFFATGCHSNWTMDEAGQFTNVDDTFNSVAGLAAMKGMQMLAQSSCYDSNADIFTNAGVIITGIWNADAAEEHFGENLGVTDLPSFTVDGNTYHLGSYTGNKLMGVKPQADSKKAAVLQLLALYLTGEECQLERYEEFSWAPSNLNAQASEDVQENVHLSALAKQSAYGQPQGQIHGNWWDIAKVLGADAKAATSVEELQASLDAYDFAINGLFQMTEEQKKAWSVIGGICGTSWDTDFAMTSKGNNVFESNVLALNQGEEFKCRQGASWAVNFGADGFNGLYNIVVETSGNYIVRLTVHGEKSATIELIPV